MGAAYSTILITLGSAHTITPSPFIWKARAGLSQILIDLGRTAEGEAMKQEAKAMVDEMAGLFEDEKLKAMFVENALNYEIRVATN